MHVRLNLLSTFSLLITTAALPACTYPEFLGDNLRSEETFTVESEGDPCATGSCEWSTSGDDPTCGDDCEAPTTDDAPTTGETPWPDLHGCAPGAGDLTPVWTRTDSTAERGEAVALGADRVVWFVGDWSSSQVRALDPDGDLLWAADADLQLGEGELAFKDLAVDAAGGVVLAGATNGGGGLVRWYDAAGDPVDEHLESGAAWAAVALLGDGSVVTAGAKNDDMLVRRYATDGTPAWTRSFADQGAAWSSDIHVTPTQDLLVSGHSNQNPGPVLLAYDAAGALQWSEVDPGGPLEVSHGVATDSAGGVLRLVYDDAGGRIDRFDAAGAFVSSIALDYWPRAIAVDAGDNVVVVGRKPTKNVVVIERRDAAGALLARRERAGRWGLDLALDAECHAYVVGANAGAGGAWLEKLN